MFLFFHFASFRNFSCHILFTMFRNIYINTRRWKYIFRFNKSHFEKHDRYDRSWYRIQRVNAVAIEEKNHPPTFLLMLPAIISWHREWHTLWEETLLSSALSPRPSSSQSFCTWIIIESLALDNQPIWSGCKVARILHRWRLNEENEKLKNCNIMNIHETKW